MKPKRKTVYIEDKNHRQVKQDNSLEKICLRNYNAIKNMSALVAFATSFCARLLEHLVIQMIAAAGLRPRKWSRDIPDYPYYMLTTAIAWVLGQTHKQQNRNGCELLLPSISCFTWEKKWGAPVHCFFLAFFLTTFGLVLAVTIFSYYLIHCQ